MLPASKLSRAPWRQGGKRKESLLLHLWNLNIEKVDVECCWLAEMTLVMMSIPLVCVFTCFPMFFLHSHSLQLHTEQCKSDSSVDREPPGNSNSRNIVASSLSISCPADNGPRRASLLARLLNSEIVNYTLGPVASLYWSCAHDIINSFYCFNFLVWSNHATLKI